MRSRTITAIAMTVAFTTPSVMQAQKAPEKYPVAPTDSSVVDEYFGIRVADPYRPLEDDNAVATAEWVDAENAVTNAYLQAIPFRDDIRNRLTKLNNYAKPGMPSRGADGKYYFYFNDGLRNQSILYRSKKAGGEDAEVFLDPNSLSDDGTVALTGVSMSSGNKAKYTAYTISRSGSDWTEIYVMDTKTGKLLDDHIEWAKFTGAEWLGDGFLYSAYPRPDGSERSAKNENHRVMYHKLGTPQSEDILVYENPDQPLHFHSIGITPDGSLMYLTASGEGIGNTLLIKDIIKAKKDIKKAMSIPWTTIETSQDYIFSPIGVHKGHLYVYTSLDAPMYRIVAIPLKTAADRSTWTDAVPMGEHVLAGVQHLGKDKFLLSYDVDASSRMFIVPIAPVPDGKAPVEISLPGFGTVAASTSSKNNEMFYRFVSFNNPGAIYTYDVKKNKSELLKAVEVEGFNPDDYVTEQVFYTSADGTRVPMFITYKKGLKRDGNNPVYLYGYGGFNISLNPGFSPNRLIWLENGGIYAQANLRGGSEYGEAWHEAGTKQNKLNVFNDFIAAGEYMIEQGWTKPELLVIEGGSNGGLLVGACVNLRPDLFAVAIPRVGVMDMMRYHLFTIGWNWASDYGRSDDSAEMAKYLLEYSPMHNIPAVSSTPYPAILVTTADHDDRVVPAHSFKYAATLQAANTGEKPKLIRIDSKAGHGAGKPIAKVIDEYADIYSFIFSNLGITPKCAE